MTGQILGFLLAMYFLVGRWSMSRLDGSFEAGPIYEQPRVWVIVLMIAFLPFVSAPRRTVLRRGRSSPVDFAIVLFLAYMICASLWAPDAELASEKAFELSLLLAVALVIAASRRGLVDGQVEHGFWWAIVLAGGAMACLAILKSTGGRVYVPGGGPNTFGRNMGMMGIGAVYFYSRIGAGAKPLCVAGMIIALLLILMCGSRGALLSSAVGALVLMVVARVSLFSKVAAGGFMALLAAVLLMNTTAGRNAREVFQSRILEQTVHNHHLAARDELWLDAVDLAAERPWFGWGLNGYRSSSWTYPHNIILEVAVEGGIVGLLLLLNLGRAWWKLSRQHRFHVSRVALSALGLVLTAAQTSGDLFDSRGVFLLIALATPAAVSSGRTMESPFRPVRRSVTAEASLDMRQRRTVGLKARFTSLTPGSN